MNVLMVTGAMDSGGAETHVLELARALTARGHGVTVVSAGGSLVGKLASAGVAHVRLPLTKKTPLAVIKSFFGLMKLTGERRFHVVHAHTRISAFIAYLVCRLRGNGLVCTVHARFKSSPLQRRIARWGDRVIAVSEDLREYIQMNTDDVLFENVSVIPNGIDTERFLPSDSHPNTKTVVFLSRLDADCSRAAYALCECAEELYRKFPDVEIVIGGGGSELERLRKTADKMNSELGRKVLHLVGRVDDVSALLGEASVFVGVSRAALEAMSCGIPVVLAGDEGFGGILARDNFSEHARSNFCGRGHRSVSNGELISALTAVLSMSLKERVELGMQGRKYVCEYHSVSYAAERTERVYSELLPIGRRAPKKGSVLLCGYYGFGNMGDDVLLCRAIARAMEKYPSYSVCALTASPRLCRRRFGIRCAYRGSFFCVVREIIEARVVVFGGGTLLQNTSSRRSLWYYLFVLRLAQVLGRRTELWGNGVEKIRGRFSRRVAATALSRCDFLGFRDYGSLAQAHSLAAQFGRTLACAHLQDDLGAKAFEDKLQRREYLAWRLGILENERLATVAIRGGESKEDIERITEFLKLLRADGIKLVFVVMYPREDLKLTRKICGELGGILAHPMGASELQTLMRRCVLVCSMRYHALVFARAVGTPFLGFGGGEKIRRFCREHSL